MEKQNKRKGFTIVELVIVIAVIAILAAVLIPTFSNVIEKANYSNDIQIARNMNTTLAVEGVLEKPTNVVDAKKYLETGGYANSYTPKSSDYHYYWCETNNTVYLVNDSNNGFNVSFPEDGASVTKDNSYRLDKEYYSVSTTIEGITVSPAVVESDATSASITLSGDTLPNDVNATGATKDSYTKATGALVLSAITGNVVISEAPAVTANYLTFTANEDNSSVIPNFKSGTWEYSTDGGTTWNTGKIYKNDGYEDANGDWIDVFKYSINGTDWIVESNEEDTMTTIALNNGESVLLRGINCTTNRWYHFWFEGSIAASGDVTSLTNNIGGDIALTDSCYLAMFEDCEHLTSAPNLPSTTLSKNCYKNMFNCCGALTSAPALPATTLVEGCYYYMFGDCWSLKVATSGDESNKIFTCPDTTGLEDLLPGMFAYTAGTFTGTPTTGTTYYWYTE